MEKVLDRLFTRCFVSFAEDQGWIPSTHLVVPYHP